MLDIATSEQLNSWFEVLHRINLLMLDNVMFFYTEMPLRQDIKDCLDCGWLSGEEISKPSGMKLTITKDGKDFYNVLCDRLHESGHTVTGYNPT